MWHHSLDDCDCEGDFDCDGDGDGDGDDFCGDCDVSGGREEVVDGAHACALGPVLMTRK